MHPLFGPLQGVGEVVWLDHLTSPASLLRADLARRLGLEPPRLSTFDDLAPNFACALFLTLGVCREEGLPIEIFETLRLQERQAYLWDQGRNRPGPVVTNVRNVLYGWHGYGLAADFAFRTPEKRWYWPSDVQKWRRIDEIGAEFGLTTGIDWRFRDMPHIQPANLKASPSNYGRQLHAAGGNRAVWEETRHDKPRILNSYLPALE